MTALIVRTKSGTNNATGLLTELSSGMAVKPLFPGGQFYVITGAARALKTLAGKLKTHGQVRTAYIEPPSAPPVMYDPGKREGFPHEAPLLRHPCPRRRRPDDPKVSPTSGGAVAGAAAPAANNGQLLTDFQSYLDEPPGGIGARKAIAGVTPAWNEAGGRGAGVKIVDLEHAWNLNHEDLQTPAISMTGVMGDRKEWRDHGTAVAGVIVGDNNAFGVVGIALDADFSAIPPLNDEAGSPLAAAVNAATAALAPGDILLIELQAFDETTGLWLPLEFWPHLAEAIASATAKGVIVVEAAGNSDINLDNLVDSEGAMPFAAGAPTTDAVFVGAGFSGFAGNGNPAGKNSLDRVPGSNYGQRLDAQGWGDLVTTAGYGTLSGATEDDSYTGTFNGTSSAAAIVAGAIATIQGRRKAKLLPVLTPAQVRARLRQSGSPQPAAGAAAERIGNLPDVTSGIWMA